MLARGLRCRRRAGLLRRARAVPAAASSSRRPAIIPSACDRPGMLRFGFIKESHFAVDARVAQLPTGRRANSDLPARLARPAALRPRLSPANSAASAARTSRWASVRGFAATVFAAERFCGDGAWFGRFIAEAMASGRLPEPSSQVRPTHRKKSRPHALISRERRASHTSFDCSGANPPAPATPRHGRAFLPRRSQVVTRHL